MTYALTLLVTLTTAAAPSEPPALADAQCAPADGTEGVPRNMVVLLDTRDTLSGTFTADATGAAVDFTYELEEFTTRVRPELLLADAGYTLELDNGYGAKTLAFTTTSAEDDTAPSAPTGLVADERQEEGAVLAVGFETEVTIPLSTDDFGIAGYIVEPTDADTGQPLRGRFLFSPTDGSDVVRFTDVAGYNEDGESVDAHRQYVVRAVDWAGNESADSEPLVLVLTAPSASICACARSSERGPPWWVAFTLPLALTLMRSRAGRPRGHARP